MMRSNHAEARVPRQYHLDTDVRRREPENRLESAPMLRIARRRGRTGAEVAERLEGSLKKLDAATKDMRQALSLTIAADGAMKDAQLVLRSMRDIASLAASGEMPKRDVPVYARQFGRLRAELEDISANAACGGVRLLDGSCSVQVPTGAEQAPLVVLFPSLSLKNLGLEQLDVRDADNAASTAAQLELAVQNVLSQRATLGMARARLDAALSRTRSETGNLDGQMATMQGTAMAFQVLDFVRERMLQMPDLALRSHGDATSAEGDLSGETA